MKKSILNIMLICVIFIGLTGCGSDSKNASTNSNNTSIDHGGTNEKIQEDNQELIDLLNTTVDKLLEYSKTNEYKVFRPGAIYQIEDKLKEDGIKNYLFLALCDKEFQEKVELTSFTNDASKIPNYDGKCTYSTWNFDNEKNNTGEDRYTLVKDTATNIFYSIKITFKKTTHYDKTKYYPIFSNSKELK